MTEYPMEGPRNTVPPDDDDNDLTFDAQPRCTARSKQSGKRCKRAASPGTSVCSSHGSKAPQTRRLSRLRLLELVNPAIATLAREMTNQQAKPGDRIKAADSILDRAGQGRVTKIETEDARELLMNRILELREKAVEDQAVADQIIDGEVIEPTKDEV